MIPMEPCRPEDATRTAEVQELMTGAHLRDLRAGGDVGDWVGLQYYTRTLIDQDAPELFASPAPGVEVTQMGWEVYPAGFGQMLRLLATVGLPIFVTENGIATEDDRQRVRYLASHLAELKAAVDDGVDVRGYLHWSAFDNFEWNHGYTPTFGLIAVDRGAAMARNPRPSAYAFAELARTGRLDALASEAAVAL
jgi:beta-glucosidase